MSIQLVSLEGAAGLTEAGRAAFSRSPLALRRYSADAEAWNHDAGETA